MGNFNAYHFPILDKLEIFRSEDENDYFPFHFHDYYCVSLITKGTEILENTSQKFYIPSGSISITQGFRYLPFIVKELERYNAPGSQRMQYADQVRQILISMSSADFSD